MSRLKYVLTELEITQEQSKDKEIQDFVVSFAGRKYSGDWIQYKNGNAWIEINIKNGTSIRTMLHDDPYVAEFPENIDMEISKQCRNNCKFCYAGCSPFGKHADIKKFTEDKNSFLHTLNAGTEVALNGNTPLHPDLELLLKFCKERKVLANLTVHELTLVKYKKQLEKWLKEGLIHGIGISPHSYSEEMVEFCKNNPTSVLHTIVGITTPRELDLVSNKGLKLLILGYKDFGRGSKYLNEHDNTINSNTCWLKENIKNIINQFEVVSFDNLAIEQLKVENILSKKDWDTFYRGDDGSHTVFVDLVNETFAKNSMQPKENHFKLLNSAKDILQEIHKLK